MSWRTANHDKDHRDHGLGSSSLNSDVHSYNSSHDGISPYHGFRTPTQQSPYVAGTSYPEAAEYFPGSSPTCIEELYKDGSLPRTKPSSKPTTAGGIQEHTSSTKPKVTDDYMRQDPQTYTEGNEVTWRFERAGGKMVRSKYKICCKKKKSGNPKTRRMMYKLKKNDGTWLKNKNGSYWFEEGDLEEY